MRTKQKGLYNEAAERSLLSCALYPNREDAEMLEAIFESLKPEDFSLKHRFIFTAMQLLFSKGKTIDTVTVMEILEEMFPGEDGGKYLALLVDIGNAVPSAVQYKTYLDLVKEYSCKRRLADILANGIERINDAEPSSKVFRELQANVTEYEAECALKGGAVEHIGQSISEEVERAEKIINGVKTEFGLATGFSVLDKTLWGLQKSDLVIVGARAGVGKTAFALNVLEHAANGGAKCLFFSLEMPKKQIARRLISIMTEIPNRELNEARSLQTRFVRIREARDKLNQSGLYIDDTTNNTVPDMMLKAKRMQRQSGLDLVVVDYLQFVKPAAKSGNRFQDVGEIARDLKVMARQLNVPVIALCQLNRALDNADRQPTLADLRESGEIENNADIIMFLNPTEKGYKEGSRKIDLIIGKFRNGQRKAIKMLYDGDVFKFREIDKLTKERLKQIYIDDMTEVDEGDLPF